MSARKQAGVSPDFINDLLYANFQSMQNTGRWYLADYGSAPGDLLLLTGKALSHATAGLRPAASYRAATDANVGRSSLAFRLMPQGNAVLDCSPIRAAGHVIPQSYVPISVSQFMDDLSADEDVQCNGSKNAFRGALFDEISGFKGNVEDEKDMVQLIEAQFTTLRKVFNLSLDLSRDVNSIIATKLINLYRTGRLV